jgi:amidohydrolase
MSQPTRLPDLRRDVRELGPRVIALRRELHEHPELAFEEVWTAATLAARIRALGMPVEEGIGGTGVLGLLEGARPGPTLLMRADMDALPMEDTTGRGYASRVPDRNHACGHDAHCAILVGVVEVLRRHRDRIAGRIAFVLQPADEPMRGAKRMIEDGLLERVQPDMALALHVLPMARLGQAVVQRGPVWASRDELVLKIEGGPTCEFARLAAQIANALYELIDTEGKSAESVTFRVRSLRAEKVGPGWLGPPRGELSQAAIELNLSVFDNRLRARLLERIVEVSGVLARAAGATVSAEVDFALPALVNDEYVTGAVERAARQVIGHRNIITGWRNPFSDDFGLFMAAAPGCLVLLGTANPDSGITEIWHRPGFDLDEEALPIGVHIMSLAALDVLS